MTSEFKLPGQPAVADPFEHEDRLFEFQNSRGALPPQQFCDPVTNQIKQRDIFFIENWESEFGS